MVLAELSPSEGSREGSVPGLSWLLVAAGGCWLLLAVFNAPWLVGASPSLSKPSSSHDALSVCLQISPLKRTPVILV